MGELGETFRLMHDRKKYIRSKFGIECARCKTDRPRAPAKILLPGQTCFDGYKDPRPRITREQYDEINARFGIVEERNARPRRR